MSVWDVERTENNDRSISQYNNSEHQNSHFNKSVNKVHPVTTSSTNDKRDLSKNIHNTNSQHKQWCSSISRILVGLLLGGLTGSIVLAVVLSLWLTSSTTTLISTATTTTTIAMVQNTTTIRRTFAPTTTSAHYSFKKSKKHARNTYPRTMQLLEYKIDNRTNRKLKQDEKLNAEHETYVLSQSSENHGKLDYHLFKWSQQIRQSMKSDDPLRQFCFYRATKSDLKKFAQNDPWVKSGIVTDWNIQLFVYTFDPSDKEENSRRIFRRLLSTSKTFVSMNISN
ncbi:hypothetical protein I4U23_015602 [Adineta vaga]|nr:hypothetical protein I4U23_015602 [Adineta vaga]